MPFPRPKGRGLRQRSVKKIQINEMIKEAKELGATAILGVDLDYEVVRGSMLMVCVSGTAVIVDEEDHIRKHENPFER